MSRDETIGLDSILVKRLSGTIEEKVRKAVEIYEAHGCKLKEPKRSKLGTPVETRTSWGELPEHPNESWYARLECPDDLYLDESKVDIKL